MPRENQKRGRRAEAQKRKHEQEEESPEPKRQKVKDRIDAPVGDVEHAAAPSPAVAEFFGLLDESEQEYFRLADDTLERNEFEDAEARHAFLENLHREAKGKELKLACSQGCSRTLEKIIQVSSPTQVKDIFQKFSGHFLHLVQHRFASHVCETLFTTAAPIVTRELLDPTETEETPAADVFVTAENLFLYAINELESNLGFLVTDRFASHTIRILLVILAGLPLDPAGSQSVVRSKRKEKVDVSGQLAPDILFTKRQVPDSFIEALQRVISGSIAGLDSTALRSLAIHPVGNPTLQLLVRIESSIFGKQRAKDQQSVLHKLIPEDELTSETETTALLSGLVYDAVGSRLLEAIIEHAPGKTFKAIYRQFFKERMGQYARNEVAGYVVCKIMERLGSADLKAASEAITPIMPSLAERGRTTVIRTLLERQSARGVDPTTTLKAVTDAYADAGGHFSLAKLLQLSPEDQATPASESSPPSATPSQTHASGLAQAMVSLPGKPSEAVFDALIELAPATTVYISKSPVYSRIIQDALAAPHAPIIFRRKLLTKLQSHIAALALHPSGSFVIDAAWNGTIGMAFLRERIAEELAEAEAQLRDSAPGRKVWKNWRMDIYKRRRSEWVRQIRAEAGNQGFQSFPDGDDEASPTTRINGPGKTTPAAVPAKKEKTRIQLARERFARQSASKTPSSGSNGVMKSGDKPTRTRSSSSSASGVKT